MSTPRIARAPSSGDPTPKNPQSWTFGVGIPLIPQGRLGALLAVCSAMGGGGKSRKCEQEESMTYGRGGMLQQGRGEREGGGGAGGCTRANKDSADKANVTQSHACAKMSQQS